ncbi:hypothetical protein CVT24_010576 [Panaeolus cyanescens]|uniref:Uncharacterized protein n=1 Tax=Panaeolus cyanescens TaxID=181874 RepID=A0A409YYK9_9AGAR|nr:hypothetical protein CVT24_010576 [Panaeolus cyanescens]
MPVLTTDPNTEVEPDYTAPEIVAVLQARLQPDETIDQVTEQLRSSWATAHQLRIQQWNKQEAERGRNEEEQRREAEAERRRQDEEARAKEEEEKEAYNR